MTATDTEPPNKCMMPMCASRVPEGDIVCRAHIDLVESAAVRQGWTGQLDPAELADAELTAASLIEAQRTGDGQTFKALLPSDICSTLNLLIGLSSVGAWLVNTINAEPADIVGTMRAEIVDNCRKRESEGESND